jgi:hypothetical protein
MQSHISRGTLHTVNPLSLQAAFQGGFSQRFFPENYALGHSTALYIS